MGVLLVGLIVGEYLLVNNPLAGNTAYVRWVIIGLPALGMLYVVIGFKGVYQQEDLHAAKNWLFGNQSAGNTPSPSSTSETDKTPLPSHFIILASHVPNR